MVAKCIEKTGVLPAKIVPTGGGGLGGCFFRANLNNLKEISQVLDFQRFEAFR